MAKLSVVMPVYNVEAYLREALEALSEQTLRDLEVIMVDDGSTDGSALIAKSFAAADTRFQLLEQDNQGQGPARNLGARHATGEFLAFCDADDIMPPHAYDLLIGSLEATGSELAAGGVRRLNSTGAYPSHAHGEVFKDTITRTSAAKFPMMLRDCTIWNKVYRRSFWDRAQLSFPATRYEDNAVAIRGYVLAKSVDVLRDIVYYWRVRESGDLSRTQGAGSWRTYGPGWRRCWTPATSWPRGRPRSSRTTTAPCWTRTWVCCCGRWSSRAKPTASGWSSWPAATSAQSTMRCSRTSRPSRGCSIT